MHLKYLLSLLFCTPHWCKAQFAVLRDTVQSTEVKVKGNVVGRLTPDDIFIAYDTVVNNWRLVALDTTFIGYIQNDQFRLLTSLPHIPVDARHRKQTRRQLTVFNDSITLVMHTSRFRYAHHMVDRHADTLRIDGNPVLGVIGNPPKTEVDDLTLS